MRADELNKPTVPIAYVLLTLQIAAERDVSRAAMLEGVGLTAELLEQPDARIGLLDYGRLCLRALHLTGEPALGYEFGLRNNLMTHGFYGFGVMSQASLGDSLEFAVRFAPLRMPGWTLAFFRDGEQAVLEARERVPFGQLRQYALDMLLVSLFNSHRQFLPSHGAVELRFDCPEPEYYARYRHRLPQTRFLAGANQLCIPAELLARPLPTADAVTARLVARECERELALLGHTEDLPDRVRAALVTETGRYANLEAVAERLHMTSRTLKRRLRAQGVQFRQLLDEARRRDGIRLLEDPTLNLEKIAHRLGYGASANFSRAFRRWTGATPGRFRERRAQYKSAPGP
jgi:AraC-like DNA-binding protein